MGVVLLSSASFNYDDIIRCAKGEMYGQGNPQLPMPPMLMVDSIPLISTEGGAYGKGRIEADFAITPESWFFDCHFIGDPVMPGCLGLDGLWQLTGLFLGFAGGKGRGRALGVGEVKLTGMVTPETKRLRYEIDIKRLIMRKLVLGIADGVVLADGVPIYQTKDLRVGLFQDDRDEVAKG
jgi:3-hydroxyacyl-[acyl-carrier protein] dehydratase/trans-2-decenoyl-[acyl-carrier protein] isomerase